MMRNSNVERNTKETRIKLELNLDGTGVFDVRTGIGFFDHMLAQICYHGRLDMKLEAAGDLEVDSHHTIEDVGLVLGEAIRKALGERRGIRRYGEATIPMDEALAMVVVDLGGRPYLVFNAELGKGRLGDFDLEMVREFYRAVSVQAGMNIHIRLLEGDNLHHSVEAIFKAFGRALSTAITIEERNSEIPSTKGVI
jgi:imidazoleglycerol-phosphate dehydratase